MTRENPYFFRRARPTNAMNIFITAILWFTLAVPTFGYSSRISVTPANLDQHKYEFSVSYDATEDGIAFRVAITAKTGEIAPDSTAGLRIVTLFPDGGRSITPVEPAIPVTLKKEASLC